MEKHACKGSRNASRRLSLLGRYIGLRQPCFDLGYAHIHLESSLNLSL